MNPRLFCREQPYHKALLLTYSFDPIFFEQVVLPDLWAGHSSDILVLGDQNQIATSTQAAAGQLWHLGKRYLLAGAKHVGAFHPKVVLRLGARAGMVMLGSGNVTSSGWGGNQELAAAWMLGPEYADKGGWLHTFLDDVLSWCSGDLELDTVRRMKDIPWLNLAPPAPSEVGPVLHSWRGRALGPALAQRWAGQQFDEIKILTGSTDESGAFLRWAHSTFGVNRATVALTPSTASFDPDKLADLPIDLRLIAAPADRPLHAKLYWFEGKNGPAAVMGSANCSAAAWLRPTDQGGNVETVVVYDQPSGQDFESVLTIFSAPAQSPADALVRKPVSITEPPASQREYEVISFHWDSSSRCLQAFICPSPSPDMAVDLVLSGNHIPMSHHFGRGDHWECELPEGIGSATVFASIYIRREDKVWTTAPKWINDLATLRHASQTARLLAPFERLEHSASSAEQRQVLDELEEVARALFTDAASFRDQHFASTQGNKSEDEGQFPPVNPNDLICHLREIPGSLPRFGASHPGTLSLAGILRLLFGTDDEETLAAAQDEKLDEGQISGDSEKPKKPETEPAPVEERLRERLAAQITAFLSEMRSKAFAERCTATQMVQAVAFPLAVALRGQRRGWVTADLAEMWALEVFSILFRGKAPGTGGLLGAVAQRYEHDHRKSTFSDVVGDGTLWLVLVATLGNANWHGIGTDIDKAVALREVFTAPQLVASTDQNRIEALLGKVQIQDARSYLTQVAPIVTRLLNEIEAFLQPTWETELQGQLERHITHKVGDLLWRENVGWAICLAEAKDYLPVRLRGVETKIKDGWYVNVSELAIRDARLRSLIEELRRVVTAGSRKIDGP